MTEKITPEDLKTFFQRDAFAAANGIRLLTAGEGRALAELEITARHLNGVGVVQGGAVFTLADLAFAAAVHSRGRIALAIHCTISFLKAAKEGLLRAEAEEVSCGERIALYRVRVSDALGRTVAVFDGTAYRKRETWLS